MGSSLFWFDNWSGLGPLYFIVPPEFQCNEAIENVSDVVTDGRWHVPAIRNNLPEDLAEYILTEVKPPAKPGGIDKPWWMLEKNGEFSVKSAWEYIRSRGEKKEVYKKIWVKGLPFKIAFLMWRVWHFKVPLDDVVKSWGYHMPSRYSCCVEPKEETVPHIFLRSATAQATWTYFCAADGINVDGMHLHQVIMQWWTADVPCRLQNIFYAIPSIIVWQLWKKRNGDKHRDKVSTSRVIYQASTDVQQLVRSRKPGIKTIPHRWHDILKILEQFVPKLQVTKVMWKFPPRGVWKCNTDGETREARRMGECTNTESEAQALLQAARYCLSKHVYSFILETASLLLKNILDREWKPPWNITFEVEELLDIMDHAERSTHLQNWIQREERFLIVTSCSVPIEESEQKENIKDGAWLQNLLWEQEVVQWRGDQCYFDSCTEHDKYAFLSVYQGPIFLVFYGFTCGNPGEPDTFDSCSMEIAKELHT
ncbi:uncharacterized protein LOC132620045 [Lycium barbarum]|uniref:uncharacterized protein LOC132620045 n=1 Tax=Lycium barbarum TaxID=112863 RepID=UPI00293EE205|nr:uncharacterized protein LOC132620045 [Lycium barbarum]